VSDVIDENVISLGDERDTSDDVSSDSDFSQPLSTEPSGHRLALSACSHLSSTMCYQSRMASFLLEQ
jgi:hypothetical protein